MMPTKRLSSLLRCFPASILALCAAVLVTACGSTESTTADTDVVIEGVVRDAYTDEPLPTAQVTLGQAALDLDTRGVYSTAEWSTSDTIEISAPGYETVRIPLNSQHIQSVSPPPLTVTLATSLRPTTLSGVVLDAVDNQPVAGAKVKAITAPATAVPEVVVTETDADGAYSLVDVPESFILTIDAGGYAPVAASVARSTSYDATLQPDMLTGMVTDQYSGEPVAGAKVMVGKRAALSDDAGMYTLDGVSADASLAVVHAEGYAPLAQPLDEDLLLDAVLRPDVLSAALVEQGSGQPVGFATVIATETMTSTAVASTRIDNSPDGQFELNGLPESGYVQVLAPGYKKAVMEITPGNIPNQIELEPFEARALYVKTTTAAYLPERMEKFYDLIDTTELNAMVIDLKSDNLADLGLIYYESQVPIIQELGTSADIMDIRGILAEAKSRGIYTIARIHIFAHDNLLAETMPEWAAQNAKGCVPNENRICNGDVFYADWDIAWLDPWNRNVWDYNIQLGVEAAQMGFDEIQFDYIRFPNDAQEIEYMRLSKPIDWRNNPQPMYENIATFMSHAHEAMNNVGAFFSADIFGYAVWAPQANIGQNAEMMAPHADYIYPMVYPSHFWPNELGFDNAAAHPYEIVYESLERGQKMVGDKRAKMRPWLQDFTLIWVPESLRVRYGVPEVQAQIDAVEDSPYGYGWAVWDPDNEYTIDAFRPE